jgi:hypothetical protein
MNFFLQLLTPFVIGLPLFVTTAPPQDEIDSSQDRIKVEKAVVAWADATFYSHTNYKFENFRAEYSEDYFIAFMRAQAYKERVTDLETEKSSGQYRGTQAEYDSEHKTLTDEYLKIQATADNHPNRADYYLIHFWSNIQTTDGITVYYEHIMKLDNAYQVTEATINSAIGKKDENTKPVYKKDVVTDDKKKTENGTVDGGSPSGSTGGTPDGTGNGSVGITFDPPVDTTPTDTSTSKPKKEKKKKR